MHVDHDRVASQVPVAIENRRRNPRCVINRRFCLRILLLSLYASQLLSASDESAAAAGGDEGQLEKLPAGMLSKVLWARAEYHYLPDCAPKGPWTIADFGSSIGSQRAWKVIEHAGKRALLQTYTAQGDRYTHPMVITGTRSGKITSLRSDLRRSEKPGKPRKKWGKRASSFGIRIIAAIISSGSKGDAPCWRLVRTRRFGSRSKQSEPSGRTRAHPGRKSSPKSGEGSGADRPRQRFAFFRVPGLHLRFWQNWFDLRSPHAISKRGSPHDARGFSRAARADQQGEAEAAAAASKSSAETMEENRVQGFWGRLNLPLAI